MSSSSSSLFLGLTEPLSPSSATAVLPAELQAIQSATRRHQAAHGCSAHTFEDGEGLWRLVAALAPRRVLEFGTGLGYTACLMAWASPQAQVDTLEGDAAHAALARQHIAQCGLAGRVRLHEGSFSVTFPALDCAPGSVDMVFFDGHVPPHALLDAWHRLLRPGGWLVCANLELNGPQGCRRAKADLRDGARWQLQPPLEGGQTWVACRVEGPRQQALVRPPIMRA